MRFSLSDLYGVKVLKKTYQDLQASSKYITLFTNWNNVTSALLCDYSFLWVLSCLIISFAIRMSLARARVRGKK